MFFTNHSGLESKKVQFRKAAVLALKIESFFQTVCTYSISLLVMFKIFDAPF